MKSVIGVEGRVVTESQNVFFSRDGRLLVIFDWYPDPTHSCPVLKPTKESTTTFCFVGDGGAKSSVLLSKL